MDPVSRRPGYCVALHSFHLHDIYCDSKIPTERISDLMMDRRNKPNRAHDNLTDSVPHHDSTNYGPHKSNPANKLDPRIDSDNGVPTV